MVTLKCDMNIYRSPILVNSQVIVSSNISDPLCLLVAFLLDVCCTFSCHVPYLNLYLQLPAIMLSVLKLSNFS